MGNFKYAVIMVFVIEMALWLFGGVDYSKTSIFNIIFNPSILISSPLYILILVTMGAFAASAIIPGNLYQINIYSLYAGIAVVLLGFSMSIVHLSTFVFGELSGIAPEFAEVLTMIIIAPFLISYIFATAEWVRGNQ